jgi:hypothetical protein
MMDWRVAFHRLHSTFQDSWTTAARSLHLLHNCLMILFCKLHCSSITIMARFSFSLIYV